MQPTLFDLDLDLVIAGVARRISPASAAEDIGAHWQRFLGEGIARSIASTAGDPHLYAVYCDYESDAHGPYSLVLGIAVTAADAIPAGLRRVRIPRGPYASFSAKGDPTRVIGETWSALATAWEGVGRRRYIADFERYAPAAMTAGYVEADVCVGLV
ncbi:MAG TPA: GyrI-like domain-containing protein [Kofleriaceae bacterium]|nr:GyrI-like domain-containing protein [Kofleriaceae bacterium]